MTPDPTAGYKSVITHAALVVRKSKLNPGITLAHEKALTRTNAKYPFKRVVVKTFAIPRGNLSYHQDNLFLSQLPTRLVIGLVTSNAFNGSYKHNPFNFQHFNLNYLNITANGKTITGKPLSIDFDRKQYVRAYFESNLALGLVCKDAGNGLSYSHFRKGFGLFAFDLSPSLLDGNQYELAKSGPLAIELKFAQPTTEPLQLILLSELDAILEITKSRRILLDYTA